MVTALPPPLPSPRSADGGKRRCSAPDAPSLLLPFELLPHSPWGRAPPLGPGLQLAGCWPAPHTPRATSARPRWSEMQRPVLSPYVGCWLLGPEQSPSVWLFFLAWGQLFPPCPSLVIPGPSWGLKTAAAAVTSL